MRVVTSLWPDVLTNWMDNVPLLQRPILDQFSRAFSQEHPNSSQALTDYAQRLLHAVRQNFHPHSVPFLEGSAVHLPEERASWHVQQAPNFASGWLHWTRHSTSILASELFLYNRPASLTMPQSPQLTGSTPPRPLQLLTQHWNEESSLQVLMQTYHFLPDLSDMRLPDLHRLMRTVTSILNVNGVVYGRFPPSGFEQHHTMSWIYMPLILQAANDGIPVIDMTLPADLQTIFDGFVGRLRNSPSLLGYYTKCLINLIIFRV